MSRTQRLAYLAIAAVVAVVAVVVLAGGDSTGDEAAPAPTVAPTTAAQQDGTEPTAEPTPEAPLLRPGEETEIEVVEGDTVRFRVRVEEPDQLHVHGYEIEQELEPGRPRTISFKATITGIFEIELHHAQPPVLAQLEVEPR